MSFNLARLKDADAGVRDGGYNLSGRGNFAPEDELLLRLACARLSAEAEERARELLAGGLRWPLVLRRARACQLFPLLHRHLLSLGFVGVPSEVRRELEGVCREVALHNALSARELAELLRILAGAGIPALPLKGVALAESLYGDLALRVCGDIDILVPRQMVSRTADVIAARGYQPSPGRWVSEDELLRSSYQYSFVREDRLARYALDLHWGILWWPPLDKGATEDFWSEARAETLFGAPAYVPSPEWEFLFLAGHAARDCWQGLKWLADIQTLCASGGIDWDKVRAKAKRFEWDEVLDLTARACRVLQAASPFCDGVVDEPPSWLRPFPQIQEPPFWLSAIARFHLLRRNSERLSYILHGLFVPTGADWGFLSLPAPVRFLYYPMRPLRLAGKFGWWTLSAGLRWAAGKARPAA